MVQGGKNYLMNVYNYERIDLQKDFQLGFEFCVVLSNFLCHCPVFCFSTTVIFTNPDRDLLTDATRVFRLFSF